MLQNTQQLYEEEKMFQIAGNMFADASKRSPDGSNAIQVSPETIAGFYNFVPVDGTLPVDRFAQANLWKELLLQMGSIPAIAMEWDIGAMMSHVMKLTGERNVDRFRLNLQPDEKLQRQAELGNVIPVGGQSGGGGGTS